MPARNDSHSYDSVLPREFSPEEVKKEYSHVSSVYNLWARLTESKAVKRALELANIHDGESVLEIAVGTGIAFQQIVEHNYHGRNEGIDLSPSMMSATMKRMKDFDTSSYNVQIANAYNLPFDEAEFDLLLNNYMLDLLPESDFVMILREFFRVLRPSGRLVIVSMAFGDKWYNHIWHWIAKHFPSLLINCRPVLIEKYLLEAGFKNVSEELVSQNTFPSQIVIAIKP